jgi:hypothetical protein
VSRDKPNKKATAKPIVKVPKSSIGRAVFWGGQVVAGVSAARSVKDARAKGDRLALLHGVLTGAVLIVTALVAARTVRETEQDADVDAEVDGGSSKTKPAAPPMLATGK